MNKFDELKKEYTDFADYAADNLTPDIPRKTTLTDIKTYIVSCGMRLWSSVGLYSPDYTDALFALTGEKYSIEQILTAISCCGNSERQVRTPEFFKLTIEKDLRFGTDAGMKIIEKLNNILVSLAFINGDFPIEEANAASEIISGLQNYNREQGLTVELSNLPSYTSKITPLHEDSYLQNTDLLGTDSYKKRTPDNTGTDTEPDRKLSNDEPAVIGPEELDNRGVLDTLKTLFPNITFELSVSDEDTNSRRDNTLPVNPGSDKPPDERTLEELLEELNNLVGLETVKNDVFSLLNFINVTKLRTDRGMKVPVVSYHLVFTGNPGTGKTTIARLIAQIYHVMGILPKGHLVETDRSGLVAGYLGQTAIKTQEVIAKAMGGVLFIDEAYSLAGGNQDSYGMEAVETILKAMEDNRDSLVVIVAGYDELMHKFINSNPGLASRFNKYFLFPDYTGEEMLLIFARFCKSNGYVIDDYTASVMFNKLSAIYKTREENFGNARLVRNIFEKAIQNQANRLAKRAAITDADLAELTLEDIQAAIGE